MKGQFFESDFHEAKSNFEWIKNLTTTLQHEVPYDGQWPGPGPAPALDGSIEDARIRVAIALGLVPVSALLFQRADEGLVPVDRLTLRIRERLTGDPAQENLEHLEGAFSRRAVAEEPQSDPDALPDGFPGKAPLEEHGITTFTQLRAVEKLTDIPGIGDATAAKIEEALAPQPAGS